MHHSVVRREDVPRHWHWLSQLVRGAALPPDELKQQIEDGKKLAVTVHAKGAAFLFILELTTDQSFWIWWVFGRTKGLGPKACARLAADVVAYLEPAARKAGCSSIKIMGRDWSFLPGFVPAGDRNHILKVLT